MTRRMKGGALAAVAVALIAAVLGGCGLVATQTVLKQGEVEFTVDSKERIAEEGGGKYLVFSTDDEAYEVTDNILFGLTESSNRYAELEEGATYRCSTIGLRLPLFSTYKNLHDCEEVAAK